MTATRLISIGFILITQVEYQVCRIFIIELEQATQNRKFALRAGVSPHIDAIADFQ